MAKSATTLGHAPDSLPSSSSSSSQSSSQSSSSSLSSSSTSSSSQSSPSPSVCFVSVLTLQWRHNGHDSFSNHQPHDCLLNRLFRRRSKKTSKLRVTGLYAGNSPGSGEFPAQRASNAENVSIWWRYHDQAIHPAVSFQWHSSQATQARASSKWPEITQIWVSWTQSRKTQLMTHFRHSQYLTTSNSGSCSMVSGKT